LVFVSRSFFLESRSILPSFIPTGNHGLFPRSACCVNPLDIFLLLPAP
jgi:hypothetical protein